MSPEDINIYYNESGMLHVIKNMRIVTLLIFVQFITSSACKKDNTTPDVPKGNWELIEVFDKITSTFIDFPQSGSGTITINYNGRVQFTCKTLRNTLCNGTYSIKRDKEITFGSYTQSWIRKMNWTCLFRQF